LKASDFVKQQSELLDNESIIRSFPHLNWDTKGRTKELRPTYNNIINIFNCDPELDKLFRYNIFTEDVEVVRHAVWHEFDLFPKHLDDHDLLQVKEYLRRYRIEPTVNTIHEAVINIALKNKYNPVKEYLSALKWDGNTRLECWLTYYCGADLNPYTQYVGQMILVAACARADKPGCKFDYMMILEGNQGIGKSQLVEVLGGQWFGEVSLLDRDKETVQKIQRHWIIEVPEMPCFGREIESLKAFLSNRVDEVRLPYQRTTRKFPRKSIFIGTINPTNAGYLTDNTGNRRFLPIEVRKIKVSELARDRDQLFAEAFNLYKQGFPLYIKDEKILGLASEVQQSREAQDEWEPTIYQWLLMNQSKFDAVSAKDIYVEALKGAEKEMNRSIALRIANVMKKLGFGKTKVTRKNGETFRGYSLESVTDKR